MKKNKFLRIIILLLPLLACACADNTFLDDNGRVVEGLPAQLRLKFEVKDSPVLTRAEQAEEYETRVENVYVFIFDDGGKVLNRLFCTSGNGLSYGSDGGYASGELIISTESMNNVTVMGIANVTHESTATVYSVTEADLNAVTDRAGLEQLVARMEVATISRGSTFMMTGYAKDGESTSINISVGGTPQTFPLVLERLDAKVKFVVKAEVPDGKTWSNFNFQPKEWRVLRVPRQSYLLEADKGDYNGADAEYFDTEYTVFEEKLTDATGGGSFVFYMPENRKSPKKNITGVADAKAAYALREKREKTNLADGSAKPGQTVQNGDFEYANDNSTYVEMTGVLSYLETGTDNQQYNINADVKLTVHLGYAVETGSDTPTPDVNDYETLRNGSYTYNVTIMGVDNILVEVDNENGEQPEPRPGYEGNVYSAEEKVFELDAHYERCLLQFPVVYITENLTWGVETPFSSGVHLATSGVIEEGLKDYKWVKFAINREYGVEASNQYVKYPGDQNYKGGVNESSPYYNGGAGGNYPLARLLDVDELITRLKEYKTNGTLGNIITDQSNGIITITAFVDEYLYFQYPQSGENSLLLWKDCVGQNDRLLHIVPNELKYSPDGNSSTVNTIYTFKQKSIQTVYNVENPELKTAWGLESVMEGDRLVVDESMPASANDANNGRFNTMKFFESKKTGANLLWTNILDVSEETGKHQLKEGYKNVFYATLLRNRDLDGDNIVDPEEIRWYLASINQLTDIYLGEYALDNDIRLYPYNPKEGNYPPSGTVFWHYASSTYNGSSGNTRYPFVLWAQVGVGKGNYITSNEQNGKYYAYRCIRNLGIALDDPTTNPTDLVIYNEKERTFDLSFMNPKAIRSFYIEGSGTYPAHNERSSNNLPYKKFQVSAVCKPNEDKNWDYFQTNNPFAADGYRVPNMREMLIFTSRMKGLPTSGLILSYTGFSMRDFRPAYDDNRKGYQSNLGDKTMGVGNSYGKVYGVRDLNE